MLDGDGEIEAQAADEREGVCRIDRQRRQDREDLFVEVGGQPAALVVVEFGPRHDDDALLGEGGPDRIEEHVRVPAGDLLGALADPSQLLTR